MPKMVGKDSTCSIARGLDVLADAWSVLIVRDAIIAGSTRFQEFREGLGVAPNVLSNRLAHLVEEGVLERRSYREPGARPRDEYVLTEAGRSLSVVIGALSAWGRVHRPRADGTSPQFHLPDSDATAHLAFVTADGEEIEPGRVVAVRTPDRP